MNVSLAAEIAGDSGMDMNNTVGALQRSGGVGFILRSHWTSEQIASEAGRDSWHDAPQESKESACDKLVALVV